ncbi:MAG: DUF6537 domain-containing protein, partial [Burkholderiaceae bacterium]
KQAYGPWLRRVMRVLAVGKFLRGTLLDPFGYSAERRLERALAAQYVAAIERVLHTLDAANLDAAVAIAELPARVRGFGAVKQKHGLAVRARLTELLAAYEADAPPAAPQLQDKAQVHVQAQQQAKSRPPSQAHAA